MSIYRDVLKKNISRLFNLYNLDPSALTYGYGDRLYWGWKISDFPNGSMQGGVHALSIALKLGLIKNKKLVLNTIDAAIHAISRIRAKNGSMVEAYPGENSFCVTALVVFDVLSAIRHLEDYLSKTQKQNYLEILRPLIGFVKRNLEVHAIISNHLATAAAACFLWTELTGEKLKIGQIFLDIIYAHQSEEGWYREYEGTDPGYQTLCTYYLFCIYEITEDDRLFRSLGKSASFLKYFVHPDGTIGGLYGSRNTEVYYPGGVIGLANVIDDFALISSLLQRGNEINHHILPQSVDSGNFIPLLNSYAVAVLKYEQSKEKIEDVQATAPYLNKFSKNFKDAGIYLQSTKKYHAILNYKKGGTIKIFDKKTSKIDSEDGGVFGKLKGGKRFSTQQIDNGIKFDKLVIKTFFYAISERYMTPFSSIIIRIFSMTLFRSIALGNLFKKHIVKLLMTGKNKIDGKVTRRFELLEDKIIVHESIIRPKGCVFIKHIGKCRAIHMASSGYFLPQDESTSEKSNLVEYRSNDDT
ncbi:MAG: hypothetical protein GY705_19280 [Bacteroidetes bacterium]|nr:hypothetical protein [Bacteroidota bacterium]